MFERFATSLPELSDDACRDHDPTGHSPLSLFFSLSERCRDVVWLRKVEGLSQKETVPSGG